MFFCCFISISEFSFVVYLFIIYYSLSEGSKQLSKYFGRLIGVCIWSCMRINIMFFNLSKKANGKLIFGIRNWYWNAIIKSILWFCTILTMKQIVIRHQATTSLFGSTNDTKCDPLITYYHYCWVESETWQPKTKCISMKIFLLIFAGV